MRFAKFWEKVDVPVDKELFMRDKVSVWGASNESADQALSHAKSRAESFKTFVDGGFNPKETYAYFNGYIQEEVIDEITSADGRVLAVLTRNYYGALVLNSESVFFGDIDINENNGLISKILQLFGSPKKDKDYYVEKIKAFQEKNSGYNFKVYETAAGIRLAITNTLFESNSEHAKQIFKALDVDPLYAKLCKVQSCFRARLSPKPWRIGLTYPKSHTRYPRKNQKDQQEFDQWLQEYEQVSNTYGVVNLIASFGSNWVDRDIQQVLAVHDRYTQKSMRELA